MPLTPKQAWAEMLAGNERFVAGTPQHPRQDAERREELADAGQTPHAALFGCADSRLAAEIIFDRGLGDLFVIRNAGQVVDDTVLGSLEYAVTVLEVPLIVVLGHDECGAVRAAIDSAAPDAAPSPVHVRRIIQKILPAVQRVESRHPELPASAADPTEVGREHLRDTITELLEASTVLAEAVATGDLAVIGVNYRLAGGRVEPDAVVGLID